MGAGRVLCDDVLRRRMRTCVLSVSSMVGRSIPALRLGTSVPRQKGHARRVSIPTSLPLC